MIRKIRVVSYGLGSMGLAMARLVLKKEGMELVAAIEMNKEIVGKDLSVVTGLDKQSGIIVNADAKAVFSKLSADVCLVATVSPLGELYEQIVESIRAGINVISTCEELAYPFLRQSKFAQKIDEEAKKNSVTVLGTGSNPGFSMDTMVIVLSGACQHVKRIKVTRAQDWSGYGPNVMALLHPGEKVSPEEFKKKVAKGEFHLLTSLPDSMNMVAAAVGWKLDEIKVTAEPIYSRNIKKTPIANIEPGTLCGFKQLCKGVRNGKELMTYQFIAAIYPQEEGIETDDTYSIEGTPSINIVTKGGVSGIHTTPAICVNMIPKVINAKPGLLSMKDLPPPAAIMGDARSLL